MANLMVILQQLASKVANAQKSKERFNTSFFRDKVQKENHYFKLEIRKVKLNKTVTKKIIICSGEKKNRCCFAM